MEKISYKLPTFEGPLDLLLHLISKNKLNIYDISISELLNQYMEHLDLMKENNMDVASEFLDMASRLVEIKSYELLPKYEECMSFTSQNYGVGKWKRMERVLIDCLILSFAAMMVLGNGAYFFGPQLLHIYTSSDAVIKCGMEILLYTTVTYFLCGFMDLFPGALRGMGHSGVPMLLSIIGTVGTRIVWIYWIFPRHRSLAVLFISYPASWIITLAMQIVCYFYVRKMLYKKIANKK